ncbi:hypothetical protein [Streptomyces sp. UG1]|uniref:hypothetical protein n=1 Tax=Streptomyces sp. UG1 TaxID=3417652 RepID=UPI003CF6338A
MMRCLLIGAVLALMLLFPPLGTAVLGVAVAAVSQPLVVAFGLGLVAGARLRRGWVR